MKNKKLYQLIYSSPMIIIMIATLLLLAYVGYGESNRRYTTFQIEKLAAQLEIVKNAFDPYLNAGLPLGQFSAFSATSKQLLQSDSSLENIRVLDTRSNLIFLQVTDQNDKALNPDYNKRTYETIEIEGLSSIDIQVLESESTILVKEPLRNKFGTVGFAIVEADRDVLTGFMNETYQIVFYAGGFLSLAFAMLVIIYELGNGNRKNRQRLYQIAYILCFLLLSAVIAGTVFKIYENGAKASTKALSDSMTQKLSAALDLGLDLEDFTGINKSFQQYKKSNPQIDSIAVTENGIVLSHTNPDFIGQSYNQPPDSIEYINTLSKGDQSSAIIRVAVSMPTMVITSAILKSSKAFVVLLIACTLISLIFLNAGSAILQLFNKEADTFDDSQDLVTILYDICEDGIITDWEKSRLEQKLAQAGTLTTEEEKMLANYYKKLETGDLVERRRTDLRFDIGLHLIKPAYFIIVFVNALSISFLPQLVKEFASLSGSTLATTSLPFTLYYLLFALVLIPAGQYAEKGDLKKLMIAGFASEAIGLILVAFASNYWFLTLGRAFSGIGQGFFLIGLQSYVMVITPKEFKSKGHAVKVIGRNSGLIAGTAIGALLFSFMTYNALFILASIISLTAMAYLFFLVPQVDEVMGVARVNANATGDYPARNVFKRLFRDILAVIKDSEFMKTLLAIGIPGKMSIAGVIMFSVPLMLSDKGLATEDIGLALMLYYILGMASTSLVTRVVDSPGASKWVLSLSAFLGGGSSILLGFIGIKTLLTESSIPGLNYLSHLAIAFNQSIEALGLNISDSYLIIFFIMVIGISNGLLAAPVMTHIGNLSISEKYGAKSVSATYVFLERFGHVTGPFIIGTLLALSNNSSLSVSFFGMITLGLGIAFSILAGRKQKV